MSGDPSLDSVDEEIRLLEERAVNEIGTVQNASFSMHALSYQELTPLENQQRYIAPNYLIDMEDYFSNSERYFRPLQSEDNKDPEL